MAVLPGTDLLLGADTVPGRPDPRSRAGRVLACLGELEGERAAAGAAAREQGRLPAGGGGQHANSRPPAAVALAAQQLRLERLVAEQQAAVAAWEAARATSTPGRGSAAARRIRRTPHRSAGPAPGWRTCRPRRRRRPSRTGSRTRPGRRGATSDPDSRLLPVRGGGFIQGYDWQDAAADDQLFSAARPARTPATSSRRSGSPPVAGKGAAVVAAAHAAHAAHAADPALLTECHGRLCTLPARDKNSPGHDAAACHAAMASGIGVLVEDAGYHSQANLEAPGPDRLIADGKTRDLARRQPAEGPPPRRRHRHRGQRAPAGPPQGRALFPRRAPDVEGLHASLQDDGGLRHFSLRGLHNATSEFLFAGLAQPAAAGRHQLKRHPPARHAPRPGTGRPNSSKTPKQHQNRHSTPPAKHAPGPNPGIAADSAARLPAAENRNSPHSDRNCSRS